MTPVTGDVALGMVVTTPDEDPDMINDDRHHNRTNALVATIGLAIVLWLVPMSTALTVAVLATMAASVLTWLTANPVKVVRAGGPGRDEDPVTAARSPR